MVLSGIRILAICPVLAACGPDVPVRDPVPLVDHEVWALADGDADPYADLKPAGDCAPVRFGPEQLDGRETVEVVSAGCLYATLVQPALESIARGEVIHLRLWHYPLILLDSGVAHIGLAFDGEKLYERAIPVPADGTLLEEYWRAPFDLHVGAPIQFHVRNHGFNAYDLIVLNVGGAMPE